MLFYVFFVAYTAGSVAILALGVGAKLASFSPSVTGAATAATEGGDDLHQQFHLKELGTGPTARAYERMADAAHEVPPMAGFAIDYAFAVFNLALAFFLLWLRPRDRTARFLAVGLVGTAGVFNLTAQLTFEIIPLTNWESVAQSVAHIIAGLAYAYALLSFPDGRPVPRWPAPALAGLYLPATAGAVLLALRVEGTARPAALITFFGVVTPAAGVLAQAYRFRVAKSEALHAQARLLFWALVPALGIGVFFLVTQGFANVTEPSLAGRHLPEQPVAVFRIFQPVFALIPLALFAGLLRYRLWDIDRVVNRTLVYGLLTAVLAGVYFGFVVLLQQVFDPLTGGSDLAVAASTLAVAAVFGPARRRIQRTVDRRFYRHRYNAARTVETFSTRLRDEIELDSLAAELRSVVVETMQPSHVTLLLRNDGGELLWQWTHRRGVGSHPSTRNDSETPAR